MGGSWRTGARASAVILLALVGAPAGAVTDVCEGGGEVTGVVTSDHADASVEGRGAFARLGDALAVGDFNDDGVDDVAVAAPGRKVNNIANVGEVYVFFGPLPTSLPMPPDPGANEAWVVDDADVVITLPGAVAADAGTKIGASLATVPGVPGVSGDALLVGSLDQRAWLLADLFDVGGAVDLSDAPAPLPGVWASWEKGGGENFGAIVAYGGDLNGDGVPEVLLGEPDLDVGGTLNVGGVWAFSADVSGAYGPGDELVAVQATLANKRFGNALGAGDVDGDGYDDLVVGTTNGDGTAGAPATGGDVRVFRGGAGLSGLLGAGADAWRILRGATSDRAGGALVAADLDGDGQADLAVGATNANIHKGRVYLLWGATVEAAAADSPLSASDEIFNEADNSRHFGESLATCDIDRDGAPELMVGAPGYGSSTPSDGRVRVLELDGTLKGYASGTPGARSNHGLVVACGDVNGDGWGDLVAGAPREDTVDESVNPPLAASDAGMIYVYVGGSPDTQDLEQRYVDGDADGWGDAPVMVCPSWAAPDEVTAGDDCDDADPDVYPGATEVPGDPVDDDCDELLTCFVDGDGDGARLDGALVEVAPPAAGPHCATGDALAGQPPYWVPPLVDCDDTNAAIHPGAVEVPGNNVDEDCVGGVTCWLDLDGDAYASYWWDDIDEDGVVDIPEETFFDTISGIDGDCDDPGEGAVGIGAWDCNDQQAAVNPGAVEGVADGVDQDCDFQELCYLDGDGDAFGSSDTLLSADLACLAGSADDDMDDCDDADGTVYPGATEGVADGVDQDCDGSEACYLDDDGDQYGGSTTVASADFACVAGSADDDDLDCDDGNAAIHPDAIEGVADGVDQDCDLQELCYLDGDGDAFGSSDTLLSADLACLAGSADDDMDDCDDADATVYPGATTVVADAVDQDCDGLLECDADLDDDGFAVTGEVELVAGASCPEVQFDDCDDADDTVGLPLLAGDQANDAWDGVVSVTHQTTSAGKPGAIVALPDLDCDGVAEFAVGDPTADVGGLANNGSVFIFSGAAGFAALGPANALTRIDGVVAQALTGGALASADLTGDGVAELVVSSMLEVAGSDRPSVHVFDVFAATESCQPPASMALNAAVAAFHRTVGGPSNRVTALAIGDVRDRATPDDDGDPEIVVGMVDAFDDEGRVVVISASPPFGGTVELGAANQDLWTEFLGVNDSKLGASLAIADVDGVAPLDLVVGASKFNQDPANPGMELGRVYTQLGGSFSSGTLTEGAGAFTSALRPLSSDRSFGWSLAAVGNVATGVGGLVVGAKGRAVLVDAADLPGLHDKAYDDTTFAHDFVSYTLPASTHTSTAASVGDVDGDGFSDFVIAASAGASFGSSNSGAVYLVYGVGDLLNRFDTGADHPFALSVLNDTPPVGVQWEHVRGATLTWVTPVTHAADGGQFMGDAVAGLGDVTGDGAADLGVVGRRDTTVVLPLAGADSLGVCPP